MTLEGPPPTRRALRARQASSPEVVHPAGEDPSTVPVLVAAAALTGDAPHPVAGDASDPARTATAPGPAPTTEAALPEPSVEVVLPAPALAWVDERAVAARSTPQLQLTAQAHGYTPVSADLLARAPRRSPWRPGVLVPLGLILALVVVYCGSVLLWPLHAVAPTVTPISVQATPAPAAAPAWPAEGSAAVVVDGVGPAVASSGDAVPMASITKLVTALLVLEQAPLAPGEQGRVFQFTSADRAAYRADRAGGESALDVPVGGSLTLYQMLQGMLIGSANNYADRLASTFWPTDQVYASAANAWLSQHGIEGVRVVEPSGMDEGNTGTPEGLLALGKRALANPVIAEIVRTQVVDLPGAGEVRNTNPLLADPGVLGIKTGTLDEYNLLAAKEVAVGGTTVRVFADAMGQPDGATRDAATSALFAQVEQELQLQPSVTAGTTVGQVETRWGDPVGIVTGADASVVLWNGAVAETSTEFSLGDARDEGERVGTLTARGPKDSAAVDLVLAGEVAGPSPWWRLTHPLELWGLI